MIFLLGLGVYSLSEDCLPVGTVSPEFYSQSKRMHESDALRINLLDPEQKIYLVEIRSQGAAKELGFFFRQQLKRIQSTFQDWCISFLFKKLKLHKLGTTLGRLSALLLFNVASLFIDILNLVDSRYVPFLYRKQVQEISRGADIHPLILNKINYIGELTKGSCSIGAFWSEKNQFTMFRAFDWHDNPMTQTKIILLRRDTKIPYLSVGYLGLTGVLSGLNQKGLFISQKYRHTNDPEELQWFGMPFMIAMRMAIQQFQTGSDAISTMQEMRRTVSVYMGIGQQKQKEFYILNYTANRVSVQTRLNFTYDDTHPHPFGFWRFHHDSRKCQASYLNQLGRTPTPLQAMIFLFEQSDTGQQHSFIVSEEEIMVRFGRNRIWRARDSELWKSGFQ